MRITFRPNRFGRSFGRKIGDLYDDYVKEVFVSACAINKRQVDIVLHTQDRCSFGEPFFRGADRRETLGPWDPFSRRNASASGEPEERKDPSLRQSALSRGPAGNFENLCPLVYSFLGSQCGPQCELRRLGDHVGQRTKPRQAADRKNKPHAPPVWSTKVGFKIGFN